MAKQVREMDIKTAARLVGGAGKKTKGKKRKAWTRKPRVDVVFYDGHTMILKFN